MNYLHFDGEVTIITATPLNATVMKDRGVRRKFFCSLQSRPTDFLTH